MATHRKKPVDTTKIWRAAEEIFKRELQTDEIEIDNTKFNLKDAIDHLEKAPSNSAKSYGKYKTHVYGKNITTVNRDNIISKLKLLFEFGDKVMVAAPETVSLVWMGISTIGKIFIEDKKVLKIIEETTEQMSAAILICEIYAQRYLGHHVEDQFRRTKHSLESQIPELLAIVLMFFYLATKHLKKKAVSRILSSSFGKECQQLRSVANDVTAKVGSLHSTATIDFEATTLKLLHELHANSNACHDLEGLTKRVFKSMDTRFSNIQHGIHDLGQQNVAKEIRSRFNANIKWFEQGQIADIHSPVTIYKQNVENKRHEGSCKWIFGTKEYETWNGQSSGFLWLQGGRGVGKSVLMSTVIESFDRTSINSPDSKKGWNPVLLYFFCKLGDKSAEKSSKILLHLCAQLFYKAADSAHHDMERQLFVQRECNAVVAKTKSDLADSERQRPSFMKMSALWTLFEELGKVIGKPIVIIVDALDECSDDRLLSTLNPSALSKLKARVLVSSRSPPLVTLPNVGCIVVDKRMTSMDIRNYVSATLKKKLPLWKADDQEKAIAKITSNAQGMFKYVSIVMERLDNPEAVFIKYVDFIRGLPEGTSDLYRQRIEELQEDQRRILITALRWLICGGGTMQLLPIADELFETYKSNEDVQENQSPGDYKGTVHDGASENQVPQEIAESFKKIGRDFLKVTDTTLQLEHSSVRDFVLSENETEQTDEKGSINRVSDAGTKDGHLIMSEHLVQTLNSLEFQRRYLFTRRYIFTKAVQKRKPAIESKKLGKLRYELERWPAHLRNAERAMRYFRKRDGESFDARWETLLREVERFMSADGKAYNSWLSLLSTSQEDRSGELPLHTASRYGLVSLLKKYLAHGCADVRNRNKDTPLHLACLGGGGFLGLDLLLDKCDANLRNKDGATPILLAIKNISRNRTPIEKLLNKKADPTIPDNSGTTCLHLAAASHSKALCELLLAPHPGKVVPAVQVDAADRRGETPLHWACKWPNAPTDLIELLLNRGANLNAQDAESQAPLYEACSVGNEEAANLLLHKGADINDDDTNGDTALHAAIYAGNLRIVKLLVEHNDSKLLQAMKVARKPQSGKPEKGLKAYIVLVSEATKDINAADLFRKNGEKQEAVTCAASRQEWEIMNYLLDVHKKRGSDMRFLLQSDHSGMIPLHKCINSNAEQAVKKLLGVGRDEAPTREKLDKQMCEATNLNGNQALHMAASRGYHSILKLLMDHGAPPNAHGAYNLYYGDTPLDAAFRGWQVWTNIDHERSRLFENIIEQLVHEDDTSVSGHAMKLHCAIERSSTKVFMLFEKWHFRKDEHGWTPALIAAAYGFKSPKWQVSSNHGSPHTHPPTRWSSKDKDKRLNVSEDGTEVSFKPDDPTKKFVMSIRANNPVQPDKKKFYFEIEIMGTQKEYEVVGVGFCTKLAYLDSLPGVRYARALTWGYHGGSGNKYAQDHHGKKFSGKFGAGDTVGCGLDLSKGPGQGVIYFTRNGKHLGTAFKDVKGQLFPILGIETKNAKARVRSNFGDDKKRPFKYAEANRFQ